MTPPVDANEEVLQRYKINYEYIDYLLSLHESL
jgi:hypothetical protein